MCPNIVAAAIGPLGNAIYIYNLNSQVILDNIYTALTKVFVPLKVFQSNSYKMSIFMRYIAFDYREIPSIKLQIRYLHIRITHCRNFQPDCSS